MLTHFFPSLFSPFDLDDDPFAQPFGRSMVYWYGTSAKDLVC